VSSIAHLWKKYSFLVLFIFLVASLFDFRLALGAVVCMLAPVVVGVFRGRFWCGNLCPRGSFFSLLSKRLGRTAPAPAIFRSRKFRVPFLIALFSLMGVCLARTGGNPSSIGFALYRMIVLTTIVGVVFSVFWKGRVWCSICPMGTLASLVARARRSSRAYAVFDSCVSCGICAKKCPMSLTPHHYRGCSLLHPDCVQCAACAESCPKGAIKSA